MGLTQPTIHVTNYVASYIQFEMDERDIVINNRSTFSATEACKADALEVRGCADKEKLIVLPKRE